LKSFISAFKRKIKDTVLSNTWFKILYSLSFSVVWSVPLKLWHSFSHLSWAQG